MYSVHCSLFRNLYLKRFGTSKQARAQVKELVPSTEFLFGGKVTDLCKELKASAELNPLAGGSSKRGRGKPLGSNKYGENSGGHGAHSGSFSKFHAKPCGGAGKGRGPGDRLSKFKSDH